MSSSDVVENLIIGSGLAGLATGMALRRPQAPFEVVDVGYDLDAAIKKASRN
jgi:cation diffusion facilitator CzcD-associated flavoprotein CzcO